MAQGDWTDPVLGRITFGEYAEAWLESRADLKPKTRHQYQSLMRQHITPTWHTVPLAKITFGGLTHWISRLSHGGLGPSAIRQSVFVMSAALDHAVRSGRIRSNPARGLGPPRPKRRDYVYLTHGQVLTLADEAGRWRLLILLLAYTGLRWGEATALRVCDIDFDRRRIDVRPRLLRRRRPRRPGHPEIAPVPYRPGPPVYRRRAGGRGRRQAPRRSHVHHARRQRHADVKLAARHVRARPHPCGSQRPFPDSRPEAHRRVADDPGGLPTQDAARDHGPCQHHHDPRPVRRTCTPARWTATPTGSTARPGRVIRPKRGQNTRTPATTRD